MTSELRVTTIANNAGSESVDTKFPINGSVRAWNNTNAAGTTINNSFNISSLTDVNTGRQDHNVTTNFSDGDHAPVYSVTQNYNQQWTSEVGTTKWRTANYNGSSYVDTEIKTLSCGDVA